MTRDKGSRIADFVHIVPGDSAAGAIRMCKAPRNSLIILRDHLALGPSHRDPDCRGDLRREFWRQWFGLDEPDFILDARQFESALNQHPATRSVVIWTSKEWRESLVFWWTLHAIQTCGYDVSRFLVAQPSSASPAQSIGGSLPRWLPKFFADRVPLHPRLHRHGASVWRSYASPSPLRFDTIRHEGRNPLLARTADQHASLFPQIKRRGRRLALSCLDQAIFDRLNTCEWIMLPSLFRDLMFVDRFVSPFGDYGILSRVKDWVAYRPENPAIISRPSQGVTDLTNSSYRLTKFGERLRSKGLEEPHEAPPLFVGGCRAYFGKNPWVRRWRGDEWRFERYRPSARG